MTDFFIGRQAVFDRNLKVFAYLLEFRNTPGLIVNVFVDSQLQSLVGSKLAILNLTRQFLVEPDLLTILTEQVLLEVSASLLTDTDTRNGFIALAERGFQFVLKDLELDQELPSYLSVADYVKIDISDKNIIERHDGFFEEILSKLQEIKCKVIIDNITAFEELESLRKFKVDYFQGHFIAKPKMLSRKRIPTNKLQTLQLLSAVNDPAASLDELQHLMSHNVSLSIKALNYVNSPLTGLTRKIDSIQEAIAYLGRNTIKSWIMMFALANIDDKPEELMTMALIRARVCELFAREAGLENVDTFFAVGIFSILDVMMDTSIEQVLESMSMSEEMCTALVYHKGDRGEALRCAIELEYGNEKDCKFKSLTSDTHSKLYRSAIGWADESMDFCAN